jgi:hypothetical protein
MVRSTTLIIAMVLTCAAGNTAAQQPQVPASPGAPPSATPGISAGEIQRLYDAYALVQAQDALRLSDEHYGRFVTRLKSLQETRRRHNTARNQILQELRRLSNGETAAIDETAMRDRLKALRDEDERAAAEVRKAYDAVDELLDVRQQARFRLFEEQMERRKLDLLMRARQNARGRKGAS